MRLLRSPLPLDAKSRRLMIGNATSTFRISVCYATVAVLAWLAALPAGPMKGMLPDCVYGEFAYGYVSCYFVSHQHYARAVARIGAIADEGARWHEGDENCAVSGLGFCWLYGHPECPSLYLSPSSLTWDCPYSLVSAFWIGLSFAARRQFRTADLLWLSGSAALYMGLAQCRLALPVLLVLNAGTIVTAAVCSILALKRVPLPRGARALGDSVVTVVTTSETDSPLVR